jgi:hypothetical protein
MSLLFLIVFVLFTDVMAAVLSFFFGVSHEKGVIIWIAFILVYSLMFLRINDRKERGRENETTNR